MRKLTYKGAGVDIEKADRFVKAIKPLIAATRGEIGGFGGLFPFSKEKYKNPLLVSTTDGVGTKLKLAVLTNKHDTVGIDLVAMNVNDVLTVGAKPLFFLDYISTGKLKQAQLKEIVKGIAKGCREADCALIGGETAEMPGMYKKGEYDLAGFCVGVVEKKATIDGSRVKVGDKVIGIASSGLHSNGFSLVRKVFSKNELKKYSSELLKPTRIYVKPVLSLLRSTKYEVRSTINAIAHITGGGFQGNIPRVLPQGIAVNIDRASWPVAKIFKLIQEKGRISDREMFKAFNMGIGMVLIVKSQSADRIKQKLAKFGFSSWVIGETIKGKKQVRI